MRKSSQHQSQSRVPRTFLPPSPPLWDPSFYFKMKMVNTVLEVGDYHPGIREAVGRVADRLADSLLEPYESSLRATLIDLPERPHATSVTLDFNLLRWRSPERPVPLTVNGDDESQAEYRGTAIVDFYVEGETIGIKTITYNGKDRDGKVVVLNIERTKSGEYERSLRSVAEAEETVPSRISHRKPKTETLVTMVRAIADSLGPEDPLQTQPAY